MTGTFRYQNDASYTTGDGNIKVVTTLVTPNINADLSTLLADADNLEIKLNSGAYYVRLPGQTSDFRIFESDGTTGLNNYDGLYADRSGATGTLKLYGGRNADLVYGGSGNDSLSGVDGDDTLYGGAGNDLLYGHNDTDVLDGGSGDDTLDGSGSGNDTYTGGAGNDLFRWTNNFNPSWAAGDTITDFSIGDTLILPGNLTSLNGTVAGNIAIGGGTLTLTGVSGIFSATYDISNLTIVRLTTGPAAPSGLDLADASDSGVSNSDDLTSDATPTITGTADASAAVTLYDSDGTTALGTVTADAATGAWTLTSVSLGDGAHTLTAKGSDGTNTSAASSPLTVTIDATAPALSAATVDGATLTLTYGEALNGAADPATSAYTVRAGGTPVAVNAVDADGTTVTLTLGAAVTHGQTVTVDYAVPGTGAVADTIGNAAVALGGQAVTNRTPDNPTFTLVAGDAFGLGAGAPALADLDDDGDLDAVVGLQGGDLLVYRNTGTATAPSFAPLGTNALGLANVGQYAAPELADLDGDGLTDAVVGTMAGDRLFFRNTGTATAPTFSLAGTNPFGLAGGTGGTLPAFADIDGDGDLDAFRGNVDGILLFQENGGTATAPTYQPAVTNPFGLGTVAMVSAPEFADIDGDGDLDALIGSRNEVAASFVGRTVVYRNTGAAGAPTFSLIGTNPFGLTASFGEDAMPELADIDGDGDVDAFVGSFTGATAYDRNGPEAPPPPPGGGGGGGGGSDSPSDTPTTRTVDGVTIQQTTQTASDGTTTQVLTVPIVTAGRAEQNAATPNADIPLATGTGGQSLLEAHLPVGVGMQVETTGTTGSGLNGLIQAIQSRTQSQPSDRQEMTGVGQIFLDALPPSTNLTVRTIVPVVADPTAPPGAPIVFTGTPATAGSGEQQAVVIDVRSLPKGTVIQLQNVEFAAIVGAVSVTGGEGSQIVVGDGEDQVIVLGADDDTLRGGGGNDFVGSEGGNDLLYGDTGLDTVTGGIGNDVLYGNQQNDAVYGNQGFDTLFGGQDLDTLFGGQDGDALYGNRADDVLYGQLGDDTLFGGQSNDALFGGQGNDALHGNLGADTLTGGLGADSFGFGSPMDGGDVIADFEAGVDKIVVVGPNFGNIAAGTLAAGHFALDNPTNANATFVFDTRTGVLSFDVDGSGAGAAVTIATLNVRTLGNTDILVLGPNG